MSSSMCATSCPLPRIGSKLKNVIRFSSTWLYRQRVDGRRAHCRLLIPRPSRTSFGRSTGERNPKHAIGLRVIEARRIFQIDDLFSVGSQPGQHRLFIAADHQLRNIFVRRLPENVKGPIAIRGEDDLLAVRRPGERKILPLIQGQAVSVASAWFRWLQALRRKHRAASPVSNMPAVCRRPRR